MLLLIRTKKGNNRLTLVNIRPQLRLVLANSAHIHNGSIVAIYAQIKLMNPVAEPKKTKIVLKLSRS